MTNSDVRADGEPLMFTAYRAGYLKALSVAKCMVPSEDVVLDWQRWWADFGARAVLLSSSEPANPSPPAMDREAVRQALQSAFQAADPNALYKFDWADFGPMHLTDKGRVVIDALAIALAGTGGGVPEGFVVIPVEVLEAGTLMMTANTVTFCADDRATANKVYEALAGVTSTSPDESRSAEGEITRPIIGIENRTAQEAFDIMADRFRGFLRTHRGGEK